MTTRSGHRFAGELDADGIDLVDRALSADRGRRPTAKEIYHYLYRVVSERTALPEVISARLVTPYRLRGQDVRIEWQIEKASNITISVGDSFELQVDTVTHRDGCLFRPDESGLVSIEVHNRFGSISMDLGEVTFDELPPFTVSLNDIPRPQVPAIEAFTLEPMIAALAGAPRVGVSFPVMPSLRTLDLLENLMPDIPSMVISTNRILTK